MKVGVASPLLTDERFTLGIARSIRKHFQEVVGRLLQLLFVEWGLRIFGEDLSASHLDQHISVLYLEDFASRALYLDFLPDVGVEEDVEPKSRSVELNSNKIFTSTDSPASPSLSLGFVVKVEASQFLADRIHDANRA